MEVFEIGSNFVVVISADYISIGYLCCGFCWCCSLSQSSQWNFWRWLAVLRKKKIPVLKLVEKSQGSGSHSSKSPKCLFESVRGYSISLYFSEVLLKSSSSHCHRKHCSLGLCPCLWQASQLNCVSLADTGYNMF